MFLNHLNNNLPNAISNYFIKSREFHNYQTRNAINNKLVVPAFNSYRYGNYSIKHQCIMDWNKFINLIQNMFFQIYGKNGNLTSIFDLNKGQFNRLIKKIF